MKRAFFVLGFAIILSVVSFSSSGQNLPQLIPATNSLCNETIVQTMLAEINEFRRPNNFLPLVFSPILCQVAEEHLNDLMGRPTIAIGNLYIRNEDSSNYLKNWLFTAGYQSYGTQAAEIEAALYPFVAQDTPPEIGLNYPGFVPYSMNIQNELFNLSINRNYREIGIAYAQSQTHHYYVFIFGSQPNVLPLVPVDPEYTAAANQPYTYAYEWYQPEIGLFIHDERYLRIGQPTLRLGALSHIRRARDMNDMLECPDPDLPLSNGWEEMYPTNVRPFRVRLSGSIGDETIYIQMCDNSRRTSFINSVTIHYKGSAFVNPVSNPTELLSLASATPSPSPSLPPPPSATPTATLDLPATIAVLDVTFEAVHASATALVQAAAENTDIFRGTSVALELSQTALAHEQTQVNSALGTQAAYQASQSALALTLAAPSPTFEASPDNSAFETAQANQTTATANAQISLNAIGTNSALVASATALVERETEIASTQIIVTATQAVSSPEPTRLVPTLTPSPVPPSPTPLSVLPFPHLDLRWNSQALLLINMGTVPVSLEEIARISIYEPMSGANYNFASMVWRIHEDKPETQVLSPGNCLILYDLDNVNFDANAEAARLYWDCADLQYGAPSGRDGILHLPWTASELGEPLSFDIYFDAHPVISCPDPASNVEKICSFGSNYP